MSGLCKTTDGITEMASIIKIISMWTISFRGNVDLVQYLNFIQKRKLRSKKGKYLARVL